MSDTIIKTKKKKYKISDSASDILDKLKTNKKKTSTKKAEQLPKPEKLAPKLERPSSPKRAQNLKEKPPQKPISKPLPKEKEVPEILIPNPVSGSLKTINIDPNYSLDGKGRKPTSKKLKEIESFLNNKTATYQTPRDDDDIPNPVSTIEAIMKKEKDKELKNMHNNISKVSVNDINNLLFRKKSPQREHNYDGVRPQPKPITIKKQEINRKRTMTNKQQQQKLINEIKKREIENAKLRKKLETIKTGEATNVSGKSNSVLILERKKQELINQQKKEMEKILRKKEDIQKIANRKKEIELMRSIESEKRKLIKLKLEEEKLSKLQYHRELNELKPLNKEKVTEVSLQNKPITSPKLKPKPNLDNIDRVILEPKNKTKKRVRFNLDDNQNYVYIKDDVVKQEEKKPEKKVEKKATESVVVEKTKVEEEPVVKKRVPKKLRCNKDKSTSDLFNDSLEVPSEYIYYCGIRIFGFDSYREDYEDIKKIPDKDMKRAIKFDYKFKSLDDLTKFDNTNNLVSRKKINIIPILYNILTNMNITLYKKRKF